MIDAPRADHFPRLDGVTTRLLLLLAVLTVLWPPKPVFGPAVASLRSATHASAIGATISPRHRAYGCGYDGSGSGGNVNSAYVGGVLFAYTYDAFGRLVSAGPSGQSPISHFIYDPLGRLCQRTINGVTTNLFYAGDKLVEEQDTGGNRLCSYVYGQGGERICRLDATSPNYAAIFYLYDARGFVTHLTDFGGTVKEQYLYDAFGKPFIYDLTGTQSRGQTSTVPATPGGNRFLWASDYEWYPEIGLYRCGARFYSPVLGRFMQPDPIGQAGGFNIYTYCQNDPINGADPSGLVNGYTATPGHLYSWGPGDRYRGYVLSNGDWQDITPSSGNGVIVRSPTTGI